jgi:hypothetical protein
MSIASHFVISFQFIREHTSNLPLSLLQRHIICNGYLYKSILHMFNEFDKFNNTKHVLSDYIEPFDRCGYMAKKAFKIIISEDEVRHFLKTVGDDVLKEIQPIVT